MFSNDKNFVYKEVYVMEVLTQKEKEIVSLIVKGLSNGEIGCFLNISENTVKTHIRHILDKFALKNRAQLIAYYYSIQKKE